MTAANVKGSVFEFRLLPGSEGMPQIVKHEGNACLPTRAVMAVVQLGMWLPGTALSGTATALCFQASRRGSPGPPALRGAYVLPRDPCRRGGRRARFRVKIALRGRHDLFWTAASI